MTQEYPTNARTEGAQSVLAADGRARRSRGPLVRDAMSRAVPVIDQHASLTEACELMREHGLYTITVSDGRGRIVALLHESELASTVAPA